MGNVASDGNKTTESPGAAVSPCRGPLRAVFVALSRFTVANGMEEEVKAFMAPFVHTIVVASLVSILTRLIGIASTVVAIVVAVAVPVALR